MAAENSDGSLIIDTELDNDGFEKGVDKLLNAVKELTQAVDTLGDNMMRSFGQMTPMLQAVANATSAINDKMGATATQTAAANERIVDTEERVTGAAQEAANAVNQQSVAANTTRTSMSSLEKEVNSLSSGLQVMSQSAESGFANGKAVLAFDNKITALEQRLAEARQRLADFGNTQIPTEAFKEISAQVEKAEQSLFKLYDRRDAFKALGVKENSKQWQRLTLDIKNAETILSRYERQRDRLAANGNAFISGNETAEFARMQEALNNAGTVLERNKSLVDQEALAQARLNVLTAQEAVAAATTTAEREAALQRLQTAQAELNELAASMSNNPGAQPPAPDEEKITLWQRLGAAIKTAGSAAMKATATLAKVPFQAMAKGVKALGTGLKSYISQAKSAKLQSNALVKALTSMKRLLITRLKRMFISSIFNSAKESLQTLAKFSDTFNNAMSNIKNSAKQLSGNLAVSMGTLIEKLEPILTQFLETLSKVITYVNAFFAMLSGKTTMTVAKKQTDSYRDSLDGAAKSAEELKNQVYGFDELNKRSDNDKDSGGASDGSDLFEEVPIDSLFPEELSKLKAYLEELKNLWQDGEYFDFGKTLSAGLSESIQTLDDWINSNFRAKGAEWTKTIAGVLNGLVDGVKWDQLGKTVADGINAVFDVLNTFLKSFDFEKLGEGIGTAINGLFKNIEWDQIGETFANKWNSLIDLIFGLVDEIDWATLGDSFAEGLSGFINTVDWGKLAATITTSINGIVEAFQHFIDGVDWNDLGSKLGTFIDDLFEGVDWAAAGQMLGDAVKDVLNFITTAIEETDWQAIGNDVAEFIGGIDWAGVADALFEGIGAALGALAAFLWGLIEDAWNSVVEWWYETAYEDGEFTMQGLLDGIWEAIKDIGTWIKEHIFQPFIDGFKKAFGINSPSTVMAEQGGFIVEGLLQGIKNTWNTITQFFSTALNNIKQSLSTAWDNVKQDATQRWEGIKNGIKEKFDAAKQSVSSTASTIKNELTNSWSGIKSSASSTWDNIKSTIGQKYDTLKNDLNTATENIKTNLTNGWNNLKDTASTSWNNITSTVSNLWNGLKNTLSNTNWRDVGTNLVNGIQSGIQSAWTWLSSTVSGLCSGLVSGVKSLFGIHSPSKVFAEIGKFLDLGLTEGIEKHERAVLESVSGMAQDVTDQFDAEKATLQIDAEGTGLVDKLAGITTKLSDIANVFREINAVLANMGGLQVPAIATGTEVPYKTRVSSDAPQDTMQGATNGMLDERLSDFTFLLRQILDLLERKKLGVDNDELAAAIAFALTGVQRGFGGT